MIKLIIFDLDGTLYLGDKLRNGTFNLLNNLYNKNINHVYYTNTSSKSKNRVINKLKRHGINVSNDMVYTNQDAIKMFFREDKFTASLFINSASENLISETLKETKIKIITDINSFRNIDFYLQCSNENFSYNDLEIAYNIIKSGACFLATDDEPLYLTKEKKHKPATGWIVAAIEKVTGTSATIIGKPNTMLLNEIVNKYNCKNDEVLIVGDSLHTDIKMGAAFGCKTGLALEGVTLEKDIDFSKLKPDFVINDMDEVLNIL